MSQITFITCRIHLRELLENSLSSSLRVISGFVMSESGNLSSQIDIIIADEECPLFFHAGGISVVPITGVRAIIEVKSTITGILNENDNCLGEIIHKMMFDEKNEFIKTQGNNVLFCIFGYSFEGIIGNHLNKLRTLLDNREYSKINLCITLNESLFIRSFPRTNDNVKYEHHLYDFKNKQYSLGYFLDNIRSELYKQTSRHYMKTIDNFFFLNQGKSPYRIDYTYSD